MPKTKKQPPIQLAIDAVGGLSKLADRMGLLPQVINHWRRRGIPAERVLHVEKATQGQVSRHQLRPDLYPLERAA